MVPKESCIVNEKVVITVKGHRSLKLNLVTTSKVLQTCYGKHENIKQFGKAILTTLVFNKTCFYFFLEAQPSRHLPAKTGSRSSRTYFCSKLTMKIPGQRHSSRFSVFVINLLLCYPVLI